MEMSRSGCVVKDEDISTTFKCNVGAQKMFKDGENVPFLRGLLSLWHV